MPKLTALRPLCGDYGSIRRGQTFETDERTAENLEARGLVMRVHEPSLVERIIGKMMGHPENKMMLTPANKESEPVVLAPQAIVEPDPPPVYAGHGERLRPPLRLGGNQQRKHQ